MGRRSKAHAALQSLGDARDVAGSAVSTVRDHAAAAGDNVGSAVTSVLDSAAERGRRSRKKAQKKARKQAGSVRSSTQNTVYGARRQSARQLRKAAAVVEKRAAQLDRPKRRRGRLLATAAAVAAVGVVAVRSRREPAKPELH